MAGGAGRAAVDYEFDVGVVGAGAAGLMAATRAAECGVRVVLLEKNRRPGVKILMSGGTRCNLTNARGLHDLSVVTGPVDPAYDSKEARGARSIQQAFSAEGGRFLGPALKALTVERTVAFFESEGVATKVEGNGKIFPASDRATDVLAALVGRLERSGATLRCLSPVQCIERSADGFVIKAPENDLRVRRVIVAVGGQSYPGCGTSGDGYGIARSFGHGIVEPRPALVPLRVESEWVKALKGLTIPDVVASIQVADGPPLLQRREALLFAHFGLTGPAILDVSRAVTRYDGDPRPDIVIDFAPERKAGAIDQELQAACRSGRRAVAAVLPVDLPRRLVEALMDVARVPVGRVGPELARDERQRLISAIKQLRIPVAGTLGFAKAEVTSGGVALNEIHSDTLESHLQAGLYFTGEVLDLDGLIGGYNFQAAWSTGWLAGESAAKSVR